MNCPASKKDPIRSGNSGPYFNVFKSDTEPELSLDTCGRECARVTAG